MIFGMFSNPKPTPLTIACMNLSVPENMLKFAKESIDFREKPEDMDERAVMLLSVIMAAAGPPINTPKDLLNGEFVMKVIWGVLLFVILFIVGIALHNNVYHSSDLTATKTNCTAYLPFSAVTVPCIEFKNKGGQPMLLQKLRVNRRSDVACNPTINKSLKTNDIYYFAYNKPLVGPFCGEPVNIEVETDNGSRDFSW